MTNQQNDDDPPQENSEGSVEARQPDWFSTSQAEFDSVNLNDPAANSDVLDCAELSDLYNKASLDAKAAGRSAEHKVYAILGALCSFHFRPDDPNAPYGPTVVWSDGRRSAVPTDLLGSVERALLNCIDRLSNSALLARIADTLWLLDKSRAELARIAIKSYLRTIELHQTSNGRFRSSREGMDFYSCMELLRRALHIGRAIGWNTTLSQDARSVLNKMRNDAVERQSVQDFCWSAELDLDLDGSDSTLLARQAEALVSRPESLHQQHRLWHIAARGYSYANLIDDKHRCQISAADCLVQIANAGSKSAMFAAHWLERAIQELYRVPGTNEQRRILKHQLIDVQSRIPDEFRTFSHETDLSEVVDRTQKILQGKSRFDAIGILSVISRAPEPDKLRLEALRAIKRAPLSSLFSSTIVDRDGKPVHRHPGGAEDSDAALQQQIAQAEDIRRRLIVNGQIEPARQLIMSLYQVTDRDFELICVHSPFVPPGHEQIFMRGLACFLQGDMIGALHILVPQLENSIRRVLRLAGHDVVKMNNDMTQEDLDLSALLRLKGAMEQIFGAALTNDIDQVFNYRGGPSIRHNVAHGKVSVGKVHGDDATYACWLILRLVCLPLIPEWADLANLELTPPEPTSTKKS